MITDKPISLNATYHIELNQLCVGLYIHLDLGWMDHPFPLSNFKIQDESQVAKIKALNLKKLRYDPARSDCEPLPVSTDINVEEIIINAPSEVPAPTFKQERLIQLHRAIDENEKKFLATSEVAREVSRNFLTDPKKSIEQASAIVQEMADIALTEGDVAIHAVNGNRSSDQNYLHSMNVLVLALMMSKTLNISKDHTHILGMSALFHDIGKAKISSKVLLKKEALTKIEQAHYEEHCAIGAQLALDAGLPKHVAKVIFQHHELIDGSGYPKKLTGDKIDPLARLISVVNAYDNFCNPMDVTTAKTPYEALGYLFASQRSKYDEVVLKRMIKTLGIYPPGSIVQLSSGVYAIVISGNVNQPLRPFVMLHDPSADRRAPVIIDLREEPSIHVSICLRPNQLPADILEYLNPRKRVSYFLDADIANAHAFQTENSAQMHQQIA
jgi:putative nucleotidyltransferase with HDIG domain